MHTRQAQWAKNLVRRWRLVLGLAFTATLLFPRALLAQTAPTPGNVPNVVVFLTDDQRYDMLEYMPIVQGELVARGINFTNADVTTPLCCASRASFLTGRYAHNTGVLANSGSRGGWRRFDDRSTLATWLQDAGVRTLLDGKYLNLYGSQRVPPGWSDWFAILDTGVKYYDYSVNNNGRFRSYSDKPRHYSSDVLARQAVSELAAAADQPFFLYLAFDGPHAPPTPAIQDRHRFDDLPPTRLPSFNEEDLSDKPTWVQQLPLLDAAAQQQVDDFRRDQIGTLQGIDRAIGTVIDALRTDGRLDNTWLVFMSDNGLSLGEHRYTRHKSCGYEDCVRVPLVLVPPPARASEFAVPRSDDRLILNIDLAPTLAALQGATPSIPVDGTNILPALADPGATWRTEGGFELWAEDAEDGFRGVRSGPWKYLRYGNDEQELYNLQDDPYELHNLAGQPEYSERVAGLLARLEVLVPKIP